VARGRILSNKICSDKKINSISEGAENLFYRLLTQTDDAGRYYGEPDLIKGFCYPRRNNISVEIIKKRLAELQKVGLIILYKVNEEIYLYFPNFSKYQKLRSDIKPKIEFPEPVTNSIQSVTDSKQIVSNSSIEDKISKDKIREDNNIYTILEHWNSKNIKNLSKKETKVREKTIKKLRVWLKDYSLDEIIEAINNYAIIISNPDKFFFTYKWQLWEFLDRGLVNFLSKNKPFENYRIGIKGIQQTQSQKSKRFDPYIGHPLRWKKKNV